MKHKGSSVLRETQEPEKDGRTPPLWGDLKRVTSKAPSSVPLCALRVSVVKERVVMKKIPGR